MKDPCRHSCSSGDFRYSCHPPRCHHQDRHSLPPCPCPPDQNPPPSPDPAFCYPGGGFLAQRILARGSVYYPRKCCCLALRALSKSICMPFTILEVWASGCPCWEEAGCPGGRDSILKVTIPLTVRLRDARGNCFLTSSQIEEPLRLRPLVSVCDCQRGQPFVQSSVRLADHCSVCDDDRCSVPLEIRIEGYQIVSVPVYAPGQQPCPRPLSWYPEPVLCP